MRTLARILRLFVLRVVVEPVRDGRLRTAGWPPGLAPIVVVGLLAFAASLGIIVAGRSLRERLALIVASGGSMPVAAVAPTLALVVLAVALLLTGALHGTRGIRAAGVLLGVVVALTGLRYAAGGVGSVGFLLAAGAWLVLLALQLTGHRRAFGWWEFPLVLVLTGLAVVGPVGVRIATTLRTEVTTPPQLLGQLVDNVSFFAIAITFVAGVAVSEVAFRASLWSAEVVSQEVPPRTFAVLLGLLAVGGAVSAGWTYAHVDEVGAQRWVDLAGSVVVLVVLGGLWWLLDRIADRAGPGSTRVAALPSDLRPVALVVAVALALGGAGEALLGNLEQVARVQLYRTFPTEAVQAVGDGLAAALFAWEPVQRPLALAVAGALCLGLAFRRARRARRGSAELFGFTAVFGAMLVSHQVWRRVPYSLDLLSVVAVVACLGLGVVWWVRGRLGQSRREALAVALLLGLAVAHRELIGDPFGVLVGVGGVAVFGLVWNFVTGSDAANLDSADFPRPARVLLVLGNLVVGTLFLAVNALQRDVFRAGNLDAYVTSGNSLVGTPLVLGGLLAVLSAARRGEEIVERAPTPTPPS